MRERIHIVEVGPRDGLQNEPTRLRTSEKIELIERLLDAGLDRIEVGSFVNPVRVPQMADSGDVFAGLPARPGFIALALNAKGVERARAAGATEINYVLCASDGFCLRNNGVSVLAALDAWPSIAARARAGGARLSISIATAFGCPYDGEVEIGRLAAIVEHALRQDVDEIVLADTIGVAAPSDVRARIRAVRTLLPAETRLRLHFHNTRNTALANVGAALEEGVRVFDSAIAGLGGCPFAPGAGGNLATEDLLYMVERMGFQTGLDLDRVMATGEFISSLLGKASASMVARAPRWPAAADSGRLPEAIMHKRIELGSRDAFVPRVRLPGALPERQP